MTVAGYTSYLEGVGSILKEIPPKVLAKFHRVTYPGVYSYKPLAALQDVLGGTGVLGVQYPALNAAVAFLEAAEWFQGIDYHQTAEYVRQGAFAITATLSDKGVLAIKDSLALALREGWGAKEYVDKVTEALVGEAAPLSPSHLEVIFRNNIFALHSDGQFKALQVPLVKSYFPYVAITTTEDARRRPEHGALEKLGLNGTAIYNLDDPVYKKYRGPWAFGCILPETIISGRFWAGFKSRYDGEFIKITTQTDNNLSVTINHPVFTLRGWVAAGKLRNSDYVIEYCGDVDLINNSVKPNSIVLDFSESVSPSPSFDEEYPPSTVEDVFSTLQESSGLCRFRVGVDDFHNDAKFFQGNIEVVGSTGELLLYLVSESRYQSVSNISFPLMDSGLIDEIGLRGLDEFSSTLNSTSSSLPSSFTLSLNQGSICLDRSPFQSFSFGCGTGGNSSLQQAIANSSPTDSELLRNSVLRHSLQIQTNGKFRFVRIKKLLRGHYNGPVYDFSEVDSVIVANNICISNCRCHSHPVTVEQAAKRGVVEAQEWWNKALALSKSNRTSPYEQLEGARPATLQFVADPGFFVDPAFERK